MVSEEGGGEARLLRGKGFRLTEGEYEIGEFGLAGWVVSRGGNGGRALVKPEDVESELARLACGFICAGGGRRSYMLLRAVWEDSAARSSDEWTEDWRVMAVVDVRGVERGERARGLIRRGARLRKWQRRCAGLADERHATVCLSLADGSSQAEVNNFQAAPEWPK